MRAGWHRKRDVSRLFVWVRKVRGAAFPGPGHQPAFRLGAKDAPTWPITYEGVRAGREAGLLNMARRVCCEEVCRFQRMSPEENASLAGAGCARMTFRIGRGPVHDPFFKGLIIKELRYPRWPSNDSLYRRRGRCKRLSETSFLQQHSARRCALLHKT